MSNNFASLKIDIRLKRNLKDLKFEEMTPIQEEALPIILEGKDIIAQAKTGSGKTVAFGLGVLNSIDLKQSRPQCLILCPTRELAEQVAMELRKLARAIANLKVLTITGGSSEYHQEKSLGHGAHIIVGTPGRVIKLLKRKALILDFVKQYVLDEADRMLDMGFIDDISRISTYVPKNRQTLLFSATFPEDIEELGKRLQNDAVRVSVDVTHEGSNIKEEFFQLDSHKDKMSALIKVLAAYQAKRFIVFCKTKRISDTVADDLCKNGVIVESIHGDLDQNERTAALTMFSNKSLNGIVATDVAARGIDIKDLDLVVNFDLSNDPEVYVHRIGRTGRAGNEGRAVSFLVEQELESFENICEYQKADYQLKGLDALSGENEYSIKPEMATIYVLAGKRDKLRPGDFVGAIVGEAGINSQEIGDILVTKNKSYIAVKADLIKHVVHSLRKGKIKKRRFKLGFL
ncbi:DEAD/DEAH box helicase [Bacteriovorax sp. BAL6_X]|uniref:ATP-dependent RNA helicase DbpA n=1 Tax=Bacteriovorax sp. BAL6_X TaxID=1201290 RepID=UPI000386EC16|nr:ATP-dependent RNA helicase DbpA [Bacteriovorax sp. BAL6_X]EPZ49439.1 DEAD/DEAH box helicase [Bacteriovorax sp. BAL6_X]